MNIEFLSGPLLSLVLWPMGLAFMLRPRLLRHYKAPAPPMAPVSIVIPARNEAHNLPRLLDSLQALRPAPFEVWVIDDGSTDATAQVAAQHGAQVFTVTEKPAGWNGKSYALHCGVSHSTGSHLLFLDSDTWLAPNALQLLWNAWSAHPGLISVQPEHIAQRCYEQLAPVLNTLVVGGIANTNGAYGPAQFCARKDYLQVGGYEAVKSAALEDIPFGQNFAAHRLPVVNMAGKDVIAFRMYPGGLQEMFYGFSKSFAAGAAAVPASTLTFSILWITGAISAAVALCVHPSVLTLALYALHSALMAWHFHWIGRFRLWSSLVYPLPVLFFIAVQIHSAIATKIKRNRTWKGRPMDTES